MRRARNRGRKGYGVVVGLAAVVVLLAGCRPSGRKALQEGDRYLQSGRPAEAVPMLERAAADLQTDGSAWNLLGRAYHELGRVGDARKAYLRALQADRNLFDAHFNLGQLFLESGAWREAEAGFSTWLEAGLGKTPAAGGVRAWRGRGIAQLRQGNFNDAERSFGSALRLDDKDAESWNAVGLIRQQKHQYRDAFNSFTHAARLNPQFPAPRLNAAIVAHQNLNDRRAALEYYRSYLALNPPDAAAISRLIAQLDPHVGMNNLEPVPGFPGGSPTPRGPSNAVSAASPTPAENGASRSAKSTSKPVTSAELSTPPSQPVAETELAVNAPGVQPTAPTEGKRRVTSPNLSPRAPPVVSTPVLIPDPVAPDTPLNEPKVPPAAEILPFAATASVPVPALPPATAPKALEIIQVDEPPVFQPARDPIPKVVASLPGAAPSLSLRTPPNESAASNPNLTAPIKEAEGPSPAGERPVEDSSQRSLWAKANPMNWFRRDRAGSSGHSPGKAVTPLEFPDPSSSPSSSSSTTTAPETAQGELSRRTPSPELSRDYAAVSPSPNPKATPPEAVPPPPRPKPRFTRYERQVTQVPQAGDRAAAEREFRRALEDHRGKNLGPAVSGYEKAVALDPTYFEAQYNLALAAMGNGDFSTALRAAESAATLRPTDSAARYQFAVALQQSHHPLDAAAELEEIARQQKTNTASHLAAAQLYANDLDDTDRARLHYEKVLELEPAHPQAAAIRNWLIKNPPR